MRKLKIMMLVALMSLSGAGVFSQAKTGGSAAPKFSSVYTDFKNDCGYEGGDDNTGTDSAFVCKPVGGFRVSVYYSAMASHIAVSSLDDKYTETFAMQQLNYNDAPGRKVEWRLADGKPFAVIFRIYKYGDKADDNRFSDSNKTGEALSVRGIKGYEHINYEVDVKTPNPNEKARELADSNYVKK
jgi:hypothetical protein